MNLSILLYVWGAFAVATAGLALFRKFVANHKDDFVHSGPGQEKLIERQAETAHKLATLDRFGKLTTIITVVFGLVLGIAVLVQAWMADGGRVNMR